MTTEQVREIAREALVQIKATPKGEVRASIVGEVAAVRLDNMRTVIFRRHGQYIRMEQWNGSQSDYPQIECFFLPPDVEQEAACVLDAL